MYLDEFKAKLVKEWSGSLFSLSSARKVHPRAKEYLHRLSKNGEVRRVARGWYWMPTNYKDAWDFLARDRGFKVIIKQTAASLWNYDFVHRDVLRLAVNDQFYKRALEALAESMGWDFEVEYHREMPYEYEEVDGLLVETPESCVVSCLAEWSFVDVFAVLYFGKDDIDFGKLRDLGRWERVSKTNLRVWTLIRYGCKLFNERLGREVFKIKAAEIEQTDVRELVDEAVEKVVEFA
jgi:hypothetical protein